MIRDNDDALIRFGIVLTCNPSPRMLGNQCQRQGYSLRNSLLLSHLPAVIFLLLNSNEWMNELRNSNVYSFECEIYGPEIMCTRKRLRKYFLSYISLVKVGIRHFNCQSILIHVREGYINFQKLLQIKKAKNWLNFDRILWKIWIRLVAELLSVFHEKKGISYSGSQDIHFSQTKRAAQLCLQSVSRVFDW